MTLCIDESCAGFNQEGRRQRLFSDDGKPTPYLGEMLKFLQQYQLEFSRTQAFCKKLSDLKLLEPMQARLNLEFQAEDTALTTSGLQRPPPGVNFLRI